MASNDLTGTWGQQVAAMRGLTAVTGGLHDAQILQLKLWGAMAFHHVGAGHWECRVDLDNHVVVYDLERGRKHPRKFAYLIASLDRSIHWLLGDDWSLQVLEAGKPLYVGTASVTTSEKIHEQRKARVQGRGAGPRRRAT